MLETLLAPLLSGGFSLLANAALVKGKEWLKDATGVDLDNATLSEEDKLKLKQYEMEHEAELMDLQLKNNALGVELEKAYLADRQSARDMQIAALGQSDLFAKRFIYYFAIAWSVFAMVYVGAITMFQIPTANVRFADTVLGFLLGTVVSGLMSFFYSSTISSKTKDNTIAELTKGTQKQN
jgi:hypothetical protein